MMARVDLLLIFCIGAATAEQPAQSEPAAEPWWDRMLTAFRDLLGPPLKATHEPIDAWLGGLPMSVAVGCALGLYVAALIFVWCLRREYIFRGAADRRWWRDLRLWASGLMLPYIAIYLWIGR